MEEDGVTLVELVMTIALTSILMAVAVPSFTALIQNNRLATNANELVTALNLARSEAVKRNVSVSVIADSGVANTWAEGWSVGIDENDDGDLADDADVLLREFEALEGGAVLEGNTADVEFFSTGFSDGIVQGAATVPAVFSLTLPGVARWRRIRINLTGGIAVERFDVH